MFFAETSPSIASKATADICRTAAHRASRTSGVPLSVLLAITLTETGRKSRGTFQPWPWTVNMEGKGVWFDTAAEARAFADQNYLRGARSFDVGCFQLNYKWHGKAFRSIEEMFDPQSNADYAAKFLRDLYLETGSWESAAGAYHSRTPKYANRYKKRFQSIRNSLQKGGDADAAPLPVPDQPESRPGTDREPRVNTFPLLLAAEGGQFSGLGSLVPLSAAPGGPRLIDGGG